MTRSPSSNLDHREDQDQKDKRGRDRSKLPPRRAFQVSSNRCEKKRLTPQKDCCKQLFEILRSLPGVDPKLLHKPKVPNDSKIDSLCACTEIKDSMVPIFFHILKRFLEKKSPGNDFEKRVFQSFGKISDKGLKALADSMDSCEKLPRDKRECLFNKKFLDWPIDKPLDVETILKEWVLEGLYLVRKKIAPKGGSFGGPGEVRRWDIQELGYAGGELDYVYKRAPWPRICEVSADADPDNGKWYRNMDQEPPPLGFSQYGPPLGLLRTHEQDVECELLPELTNLEDMYNGTIKITEECTPKMPPASADFINLCDGGERYTHPNACLKIPDALPGNDVSLQGFNFFSSNCKVKLIKQDDPSITYTLLATWVMGDVQTPLRDENNKIIADCRVQDRLRFTIPNKAPSSNSTFIPGRYEVKVIVPNDKNEGIFDVPSGEEELKPNAFDSNSVLLNIWPDPNLLYSIYNDEGFCLKETSGGGADEIWWTAGVASFKLSTGVGGTEPVKHEHTLNTVSAEEGPWSDMDSGEFADPYNFSFFTNQSISMPGSVAIALVGFEVDDEDVALEQLKEWKDAFGYAMKEIWEALVSLGGSLLIEIVKAIANGGIWGLVAAIAVIVITFIAMAIWAAWAPADLVAHDVMMFTTLELFDRTNSTTPAPPETVSNSYDDAEQSIDVATFTFKSPSATESTLCTQERWYENWIYVFSPEEDGFVKDAESLYILKFRFSRHLP